jgi:hypothetical protein
MFVMTLAASDSATAADVAVAGGTVAMAIVAFVCMTGSFVGWWLSRGQAKKATAAVTQQAKAQTTLAHTVSDSRADEKRAQARLITVEAALHMGREGVAVRNSSDASVFELHIDIVGDDSLVVISGPGAVTVTAPAVLAVLGGSETTSGPRVYQKVGGSETMALIRETRIRFRDGRGDSWSRTGNGEPDRIDPLDHQ